MLPYDTPVTQVKRDDLRRGKERLENGIDKIAQASSQVTDLQRVLKEEQIVVEEKKAQTDELIVSIGREKAVVDQAVEAGREVRDSARPAVGRGTRRWRRGIARGRMRVALSHSDSHWCWSPCPTYSCLAGSSSVMGDCPSAVWDPTFFCLSCVVAVVSAFCVAQDEDSATRLQTDVSAFQAECERDLADAEPIIQQAEAALDSLNKKELSELKSFGSPAAEIVQVAAACLVLTCGGKIPKDRDWNAGKKMMADVNSFLASLKSFDKDNVPVRTPRSLRACAHALSTTPLAERRAARVHGPLARVSGFWVVSESRRASASACH